MGYHKAKQRGCRLPIELDNEWQAFLDSTGQCHNKALKFVIKKYLKEINKGQNND